MNGRTDSAAYALNELENQLRKLLRDSEGLQNGLASLQEGAVSLVKTIGHVRLTLDGTLTELEAGWDELVRLGDRLLPQADCYPQVRQLLEDAFARLNYHVYGLPGERPDLSEMEVVSTDDAPAVVPGTIVRTLQIGLRRSDGVIQRLPKVILAGKQTSARTENRP